MAAVAAIPADWRKLRRLKNDIQVAPLLNCIAYHYKCLHVTARAAKLLLRGM
jgi:hypothetical protein